MFRSRSYLDYIKNQMCEAWEAGPCQGDIVPHHEALGRGGRGIKTHDTQTIPLCDLHHQMRHNTGFMSFWMLARREPEKLIIKHISKYINQNGYSANHLIIEFLTDFLRTAK
jgi:hypothetical protein